MVVSRKRHIAVDIDGYLLTVDLTTAKIADSDRAQAVFEDVHTRRRWVKHLFAESTCDYRQLLNNRSR